MLQLLLYFIIFTGVNCIIQFQHDTEQCLDQLVEYQCTVTGTGFTSLTWRISDDNGTQLGNTVSYTSNGGIGALVTIGEFTVEQLQPVSPVVSNISFTVQSSINGYTIECEDSTNALNNESDTINDDDKCVLSFGTHLTIIITLKYLLLICLEPTRFIIM